MRLNILWSHIFYRGSRKWGFENASKPCHASANDENRVLLLNLVQQVNK